MSTQETCACFCHKFTPEQKLKALELLLATLRAFDVEQVRTKCIPESLQETLKILFPKGLDS